MGNIRVGATELGLKVQWRYEFIGPGSTVQPCPDAVFLDVGGSLQDGVLDQHHDMSLGASTTELVLSYPAHVYNHLMLDWLRRHRDGEALTDRVWTPVIVTHFNPDFDAVVSAHLVMKLVEDGGLPPYAQALVQYASTVDQGKYQVDMKHPETATHAIHMAYLTIQSMDVPEGKDRNLWPLQRGLDLIEVSMASVKKAQGVPDSGAKLLPGRKGADGWREVERFQEVKKTLDEDQKLYLEDREDAETPTLSLPADDGSSTIDVPTLILRRPGKSKLNKYWVRAEGFPYFVCPYAETETESGKVKTTGEGDDVCYPKVIPSLDPIWSDPDTGRKPTLRGLGFSLERAEVAWRQAVEGGDQRPKPPRHNDGSCNNSDPWYDGRGHDHTIVDAPNHGTHLPYREVVAVARSDFWKVPVDQVELFVMEPRLDLDPTAPDGVEAVPAFTEMADTLEPYVEDCREAAHDGEAPAPPPGMKVQNKRVRYFPAHTAPPTLVYELTRDAVADLYLEDLRAWVRERRKKVSGRLYICARLRLVQHFAPTSYLDLLLDDLGGGDMSPAGTLGVDEELVLFNSRAIVARATPDGCAESRLQSFRELMLYAVFLNETLNAFSREISAVVGLPGQAGHANRLGDQFLNFQARHYQQVVTANPWMRRMFDAMRDGLCVEANNKKVEHELDRLSSAADRESANKMEWLLFLITLLGIVSTILGFPATGGDWEKLFASPLPWTALISVVALTFLFWLVKRGPKPGPPDPPGGSGEG